MFKWISWALRLVATALLLSFLCIWTTGYIVNSYMESVLKQLNLPLEVQPLALSGVWGTLWGAERAPQKEAAESPSRASQQTQGESRSSPSPSSQPSVGGSEADGGEATDEAVPPPEPAGAEPDYGEESPPDEAVPVFGDESSIGQLTDEQRQSLYSLVVSKLNPEQLRQLSNSLQDGLTPEELEELQDMLRTSLTDEEYMQMMRLLQGEPALEE
ncbi:hypothetical protein [Cohnella sp.]|uniref:hypothetical protein n=1 Tax=Cohnella sp. TaxID=1883426 RepID=UPI003566352A